MSQSNNSSGPALAASLSVFADQLWGYEVNWGTCFLRDECGWTGPLSLLEPDQTDCPLCYGPLFLHNQRHPLYK